MRGRAIAVVTALLVAVLAIPARATDITTIPVQETGVVDWVQDGDTFRFLADGAATKVSVRMLGMNAPEVAGFKNSHFPFDFCGGLAAEARLKELLPIGTRVQLRSLHAESQNRGRILRSVFAYDDATGQYDIDVVAQMLREGWGMWFTLEGEASLSADYRGIVDSAQAARVGIWNPTLCGPVEQPDANVTLTVVWDAPSNDATNLNGEYVIVRNTGAVPVDLTGWLLRDSSLEAWYTFPAGSVLSPDDYRVVHVGSGQNGVPAHDLYMGAAAPIFANVRYSPYIGDGAYLLDRSTAIRAWTEYPCSNDCTDPLQGKVRITAVQPRAGSGSGVQRANGEYIVLRNVSKVPVRMDGAFLRRTVSTYTLLPNTVIKPGRTLTVRMGRGTPTATTQYWGLGGPLLNDVKDAVELRSPKDVLLSVKRWG